MISINNIKYIKSIIYINNTNFAQNVKGLVSLSQLFILIILNQKKYSPYNGYIKIYNLVHYNAINYYNLNTFLTIFLMSIL